MTLRDGIGRVIEPVIIAHRGASGYLPEHTLAAKSLAHAQGADFLEQDIVATRDGRLIVCHDLFLERVTDVASAYPGRARGDGHYYAIDFDWKEIASLRVVIEPFAGAGRTAHRAGDEPLRISTLEEELDAIRALNRNAGREAGIYPEIKQPQWHAEQGIDLCRAVLGVLWDFGYRDASDNVFLQCFDARALQRCREELGSSLPLIQLIGRSADPVHLTPAGLAQIGAYAAGVGVNYKLLLLSSADGVASSPAVAGIREAGLLLHPYTLSRSDLPEYIEDLEGLLALVFERIRPDGVFCDFPDLAVELRRRGRERISTREGYNL